MPRPDASTVTAGFDTALDDAEITAFLDDAGVLLRQAYDDGELDAETDTALWKYLTRHLIRFTVEDERQVNSQQLGSAQKSKSGDFGRQLEATSPGQTALQLDPEGRLVDLGPNEDTFFRSV